MRTSADRIDLDPIAIEALAHQVMWHRFVNTKGGMGKNIPCDLYNEHVNRLVKYIKPY